MGIPSSPFTRLTIAIALTVCALTLSLIARTLMGSAIEPNLFLPFLGVVLVSSWFLGRAAGVLTTGLSAALVLFFFSHPLNSFGVEGRTDTARVLAFLISALVVTILASAARESRTHLEETLSSIRDAVFVTDYTEHITFLNPVAEGLTGWSLREARKKRLTEILTLQDEKTGKELAPPIQSVLREGKSIQSGAHKVAISRDGNRVLVEESGAPVRDERGRVAGSIFIFRDITSRREVQDQASQSQKMEAVGRLARGVAGDFNQLLTVISGFSDILRRELAAGNPLHRYAHEIYLAGDRAAGLTRQLLALGSSQYGELKTLDLSSVIPGMETMLRRLMGSHIDVLIMQSPGAAQIKGDASQIEQMIVNLAMNSRDAMPEGGKFVIDLSNTEVEDGALEKRPGIAPGKYVLLSVSDTGTGMDAETRGRLFEPFFTTKEKSKATGLGLSIVYGIVQQSKGFVNVYSQLGSGTIFEIYLPREAASPSVMPSSWKRARPKGTETILVADDEDGVRTLVHAVLATNGYSVLEARDGREALAIYESNESQIDMVVTDIVMPNMTGLELGERLAVLDAKLRVLYISGYRDSPIGSTESGLGENFHAQAIYARRSPHQSTRTAGRAGGGKRSVSGKLGSAALLTALVVSGLVLAARALFGPGRYLFSVHSPMNVEGLFALVFVALLVLRDSGAPVEIVGRNRTAPWAALLAIIVVAAFTQYLAFPFLADGYSHIWTARHANSQALWAHFTTPETDRFFRPVGYLSYALDATWEGLSPTAWRGVNLALHAVNTLLVFRLCLWIGSSRWAAFAGALVFGLHGSRPEAVTWVAARFDLLAVLFGLACILLVLRGSARGFSRSLANSRPVE